MFSKYHDREKKVKGIGERDDQLAKLKSLLDSGAITQAEYDAEKQKILSQ